jgi:hypothetical protein
VELSGISPPTTRKSRLWIYVARCRGYFGDAQGRFVGFRRGHGFEYFWNNETIVVALPKAVRLGNKEV